MLRLEVAPAQQDRPERRLLAQPHRPAARHLQPAINVLASAARRSIGDAKQSGRNWSRQVQSGRLPSSDDSRLSASCTLHSVTARGR